MPRQRGQDEAVVLAVEHGQREGELVAGVIEGIVAHKSHLLEGGQLHGREKLLLMQHIFGGTHHFPKLSHFGREAQLERAAVFAIHEIFVLLGQTVQLISHEQHVHEKKDEKHDDDRTDDIKDHICTLHGLCISPGIGL